jgi:hypothetical protein
MLCCMPIYDVYRRWVRGGHRVSCSRWHESGGEHVEARPSTSSPMARGAAACQSAMAAISSWCVGCIIDQVVARSLNSLQILLYVAACHLHGCRLHEFLLEVLLFPRWVVVCRLCQWPGLSSIALEPAAAVKVSYLSPTQMRSQPSIGLKLSPIDTSRSWRHTLYLYHMYDGSIMAS